MEGSIHTHDWAAPGVRNEVSEWQKKWGRTKDSSLPLPPCSSWELKMTENSKFESSLSSYHDHAFVNHQYAMWATICILAPGSSNFRGGPGDNIMINRCFVA